MTIFQILTRLSILFEKLNSGLLTSSQRSMYSRQFAEILSQLHSGGNIYLPPWVRRQLIMHGMRRCVARRLLCLPGKSPRPYFKFFARILGPSIDFYRYQHYIYDPSHLHVMKSIKNASYTEPIGCCWAPHLGCLLVTTQFNILKVAIDTQPPRYEVFYRVPGGNNYGIDVAADGTIAMLGYNANRVFLISPQGKLIGEHVIVPNSSMTWSGVSFSHDDTHIICFSRNGIHILRRNGTFLCTIGGEGSRPGFFRGEGQIIRLAKANQFAISDIKNNRVQIVEFDFQAGSMKVCQIIGTDYFYKPLGIVEMGNCIVAFSHQDGCAYVWDGEKYWQVLDKIFYGARFACKIPGGRIAICNKHYGSIQILAEKHSVPTGLDCLDMTFRGKPKKCLINVADSGVKTSAPVTQVANSGVQTSAPVTQVTDSGVQTNSPTESIFQRLFQYFSGYQLF